MAWLWKLILNWFWGKFMNELVPKAISWAKRYLRQKQIDEEVEKETLEIIEIKKQIKEYQEKNGTTDIPPNLRERLLNASRRRVGGL